MEKNLLLITEDTDTSDLLVGLFQSKGYQVKSLANTKNCFDILRDEAIDLVFIDLDCATFNPLKFLTSLRQREPLQNLPMIVLGENINSTALTQLKTLKVEDFILKPFDPEDAVTRVDDYFVASAMNPSAIQKILQRLGKADPELFEKGRIEGFERDGWQAFRSDFSKIELAMVVPKDYTPEALAKLSKNDVRTQVRVYIVHGSTWKKIWPKADKGDSAAAA